MSFRETVNRYSRAASGRHESYDAAMNLPQAPDRKALVEQADGIVRANYAITQWIASVGDAAAELRELVTIHDNGGSASSPAKIKNAARELLRLIGEG